MSSVDETKPGQDLFHEFPMSLCFLKYSFVGKTNTRTLWGANKTPSTRKRKSRSVTLLNVPAFAGRRYSNGGDR